MPIERPPVLQAEGLTKRYGRHRALTDCTLTIPPGRVIGLVGPNGAGKSTLLQLCCGLIKPTEGSLRVLGARPAAGPAHLARVGYIAQDTPVYGSFTVADHLSMAARLNPGWDRRLAERWIAQAGLPPTQRAGQLSGGQRAQLALTLAAAKRPELLIYDEPAATLDPLARAGFLENLMESVGTVGAAALLSSHRLSDVERVCDHLVVLYDSRVQLAGDVHDLLAEHHRVIAPRGGLDWLPPGVEAIWLEDFGGYSGGVVRAAGSLPRLPWTVEPVQVEELVLSYLSRAAGVPALGEFLTGPVRH